MTTSDCDAGITHNELFELVEQDEISINQPA